MPIILTCVRATGNPDALDDCLYGLGSQITPAGVTHLIAVFDASPTPDSLTSICNYWAASTDLGGYCRRLVHVPVHGLESEALHDVMASHIGNLHLDYVAFLDDCHAPHSGWLGAMYGAIRASGADAVHGAFAHCVPWDSSPRITPHRSHDAFASNTFVCAAWLRDDWARSLRWAVTDQAAVTVFAQWPSMSGRAAVLEGWRIGSGARRLPSGRLLIQFGRACGRLARVPFAHMQGYCAASRRYSTNVALGELGEVAGLICGRRQPC